jgi:hypothetical protein
MGRKEKFDRWTTYGPNGAPISHSYRHDSAVIHYTPDGREIGTSYTTPNGTTTYGKNGEQKSWRPAKPKRNRSYDHDG